MDERVERLAGIRASAKAILTISYRVSVDFTHLSHTLDWWAETSLWLLAEIDRLEKELEIRDLQLKVVSEMYDNVHAERDNLLAVREAAEGFRAIVDRDSGNMVWQNHSEGLAAWRVLCRALDTARVPERKNAVGRKRGI